MLAAFRGNCAHQDACTPYSHQSSCCRAQIAAIFEFGGALLLGRVSTGVIQGGIANLSTFQRQPAIYAYGMVCAMAVGGVWQGLASYMELNVSATHSISESLPNCYHFSSFTPCPHRCPATFALRQFDASGSYASQTSTRPASLLHDAFPAPITRTRITNAPCCPPTVGAIIGFSLVYGGKDAVNWATPAPNLFPPYSGVVPIVCAWVFAPLATASAAALIMYLCRTFVLRRNNPARLAMFVLPLAVFITTWINIYFVFTKVGRGWARARAAAAAAAACMHDLWLRGGGCMQA